MPSVGSQPNIFLRRAYTPDSAVRASSAPAGRAELITLRDSRRGNATWHGHNPTLPSMRSRNRSAWPMWRAYSSIMWTSTSRSDTWPWWPPRPM
jgi:hypothetical protein